MKHWKVFKTGGHLPMEQPEILVNEIREFFRNYRSEI